MANSPTTQVLQVNANFTPIGGNTDDTNAVLDLAQLQWKPIIRRFDNTLIVRQMLAQQNVGTMTDAGTFRIRMPERNVAGTDYGVDNGSVIQPVKVRTADFQMDQILSYAIRPAKTDIRRFSTSPIDIQRGLVSEWLNSLAYNLLLNKELLIQRAHQEFCIATYPQNPYSVLVLDLNAVTDADSAEESFYNIANNFILPIQTMVNEVAIGVNDKEIFGVFGPLPYNQFTRAYTKFLPNNVAPDTLATGELYKNMILGTDVYKNIWLGRNFPKTDLSKRINKDIDYNFKDTLAMFMYRNMWVAGYSFEETQTTFNFRSLNNEFRHLSMHMLPVPLYEWGGFIIMDKEPTPARIAQAQGYLYEAGLTGFEKAYQLPQWMRQDFQNDVIIHNQQTTPALTNIQATQKIVFNNLIDIPGNTVYNNGTATDYFGLIMATPEIQTLITANWDATDVEAWVRSTFGILEMDKHPQLAQTSTLTEIAVAEYGASASTGCRYLHAYQTADIYTGTNAIINANKTNYAILKLEAPYS